MVDSARFVDGEANSCTFHIKRVQVLDRGVAYFFLTLSVECRFIIFGCCNVILIHSSYIFTISV